MDFTVYGFSTEWYEVGGVYIFAAPADGGNWHALYVGQTQSFAERLPGHEKHSAAVRAGATHIHALVESSAKVRASIEASIIRSYNPPLNST